MNKAVLLLSESILVSDWNETKSSQVPVCIGTTQGTSGSQTSVQPLANWVFLF